MTQRAAAEAASLEAAKGRTALPYPILALALALVLARALALTPTLSTDH